MYAATGFDRPQEIQSAPQPSPGSPCPAVLADDHTLRLAYYVEEEMLPQRWHAALPMVSSPTDHGELCALLTFSRARAHLFGPPSDETFHGHPLASKGLEPYGVYEVEHSSWLRALVTINSVHPRHRPEAFRELKHFIFSFHDSTFECIAAALSAEFRRGTPASVISAAGLGA